VRPALFRSRHFAAFSFFGFAKDEWSKSKTPPGKERRLRLIRAGYLPGFFGGLAGFRRSPVAFSTTDKAFCEKSLRMRGFFFTRPIYHPQAALEAVGNSN
jgi:hypothetical protein